MDLLPFVLFAAFHLLLRRRTFMQSGSLRHLSVQLCKRCWYVNFAWEVFGEKGVSTYCSFSFFFIYSTSVAERGYVQIFAAFYNCSSVYFLPLAILRDSYLLPPAACHLLGRGHAATVDSDHGFLRSPYVSVFIHRD